MDIVKRDQRGSQRKGGGGYWEKEQRVEETKRRMSRQNLLLKADRGMGTGESTVWKAQIKKKEWEKNS